MNGKPTKLAIAVLLTAGVIYFVVVFVANFSTASKMMNDTANYTPAEERRIEEARDYSVGAVCGFAAGFATLGAGLLWWQVVKRKKPST